MGFEGKLTRSKQKQDFSNQIPLGVGFKNVVFAHKFLAASSTIDLTALTTPSAAEIPNFVNPSVASLLASNIVQYQNNLVLMSTTGGSLIPGLEYQVTSNSTIRLTNAVPIGTIIYGYLNQVPQNGIQVVGGQSIASTGVLAVGQTQINVGSSFAVNANSAYNIGVVQITRNGRVLKRNTGNSSTIFDKDYYELGTSLGVGTIVVLNRAGETLADGSFEEWTANSFGPIADNSNNGTQASLIQSLAAQVNAMVTALVDVTGQPTSFFTTNPAQVDLRTFGDLVNAIQAANQILPKVTVLTSGSGSFIPLSTTKWMRTRLVGGAGGGQGSSTTGWGNIGSAGITTTFGPLVGGAGQGGNIFANPGGTSSLGTITNGIAQTGGAGNAGQTKNTTSTDMPSGAGGISPFGGNGGGTVGNGSMAAVSNSGSGGGGAAMGISTAGWCGAGGSAGGYVDAIIQGSALTGSFAYLVGTGGAGGAASGAGSAAGGAGGSGVIIIEEYAK